jgi:hypothetical protein
MRWQLDGVRVVAKTSSFSFAKGEDSSKIGRKLNAGSVLQAHPNVTAINLRRATTRRCKHGIAGVVGDVTAACRTFRVQNQLSTAIAGRLVDTLTPGARLRGADGGHRRLHAVPARTTGCGSAAPP